MRNGQFPLNLGAIVVRATKVVVVVSGVIITVIAAEDGGAFAGRRCRCQWRFNW